MIYVDQCQKIISKDKQAKNVGARNGHMWCHMWSNSVEELHTFALTLGLKRQWFQDRPGFPHYDITFGKRELAIKKGATPKYVFQYLMDKRILGDLI